jgi:toxin ParE1/3/4
MAYRVSWSARALRDVEAIADYIALDSPAYAKAVVKRIVNVTRTLSSFPNSGRTVPEFQDPQIREVFAYSYRVIYRLDKEDVLVVAVIHGKRDLT